jgi:aspartate beta-hydroxylase
MLREGRLAEAEQLFASVLAADPDHVEALHATALAALRAGDAPRAATLLEHGVQRAPEQHAMRLYLGVALERAGNSQRAVLQYLRALNAAQAQGRWLNADTTPAPLRPLIERAVTVVRAGRRDAFARLLAPLEQRFGRGSLSRVGQCLRIYLREEPAPRVDVRQQPTFLYFPGLTTAPYLDRRLFPWIDALEADSPAIHAELMRLLTNSSPGSERVFGTEELERQNLRGRDAEPSWTGYYFYRHGVRRDDNCASCPDTARALDRLPLVHVREHGPEVLYSVFTPGTHLLPHRGITNTRLVGHLPLVIPENCALSVGGEQHVWESGRVVVFDDTYEHEAWNRSGQTRVVMIFDVWHPDLTEAERVAVTEVVETIGDFRKAVDAA